MNAARKSGAAREAVAGGAPAEAGMILLDLSFQPFAIDHGATSILAARSRDRRCQDTVDADPSLAVAADVRDLMQRAEPTGPDSMKVSFLVGKLAYTGRTYLVEPQGARQSLIVLHLSRDVSARDPLAEVGTRYRLTEREHEVLRGIAIGLTNKELAQRMNITPNTVKTFLRLVMVKMRVTRRSGVVAKLLEHIDVKVVSRLLQLILCFSILCGAPQAGAAAATCSPPLCVNRLDDSAAAPLPGMLRFAVLRAPAGGSITFDPALSGRTILLDASLRSNHIRIDRDIAIQGPGSNLLTVSGGTATRIFFIEGSTVRIDGLTLADGLGKGGDGAPGTGGAGGGGGAAGMGGAIFLNSGSLMLSGVVLSGNRAAGGSGANGGSTFGPGEGGSGGGFGGNGASGPKGAGATGDLRGKGARPAGSGGAGGDSAAAGVGGGEAGFGGGEAAAGSASMVAAEPPAPGVVTVSEVELAVRPDFWIRMEPPPPASAAWAAPLWGVPSSSGRVSCSWPTPRFWAIQLLAVWARRALPTARRKAAPYSFVRPSCAGPARRPQAPGREIRRSAGTRRISERAKAV